MGKTSFYLSKEMEERLRIEPGVRGVSVAINEVLDRYRELIESGKRRLRSMFTDAEWLALYSACNGTVWQPAAVIRGGVLANIEDTYPEEFPAPIDKPALVAKLRELDPVQQFALVEMIEDWWHQQGLSE